MAISERLCCCLDVATGSILTGIYTCFLSLVFIAIGIDSAVEVSRNTHNRADMVTLNAVYGLLIGLSVLYGIASISLVLGASRKLKTYLILWIVLTPIWTVLAFSYLIVLPVKMSHAIKLTNLSSRICGTVFVMTMNIFCMVCVCLFVSTLVRSPAQKLRSLGVVEALETGFSNGYSRLRESIRPKKSKSMVNFNSKGASTNAVSIPEFRGSVVLDPNRLEVARPNPPVTNQRNVDHSAVDVGDDAKQSLSNLDQLGQTHQPTGLSNPGFLSDD